MAIVLIILLASIAIGLIIFYFHKKLKAAALELQTLKHVEVEVKEKLKTTETELQLTTQDAITGLPTWVLFEDRLNQMIKESMRYQLHIAVLYIDIDDFKMINNALGYEAGNQVLREVSFRLQSCIRKVDSISRFSKDIFAVLLTQLLKPEVAAIVAQRVIQAFEEPIKIGDNELNVTVGIGIAVYANDGENAETLLSHAEHAMHLARKAGKNTFQFYEQHLSAQSKRELVLYTGLGSEAIFNELLLYYQPVMNVQREAIFCMDVLVHWQSAEFNLIPPHELEQLAERRHRLNKISEWTLQKACQQFAHWRASGFNPEFLSISLFVSQLSDTHFVYRLSQIMQESHFNPEWMMLRIKETGKQASFDVIEKAFNMLNYLKVQLAIDNVGASSFSFRYLKNFSIRFLRLDSTITSDIETNPKTALLVQSLLSFAEKLSMQVIIQDVESASQLEALKAAGCTLLQGQYFGALLTEKEVAAMVTSQ